jgi:hypothetical protein
MNWLGKYMRKQDDKPLKYSDEERKIFAASFSIGWTVVGFGIGGVIFIAIWGWGVVRGSTASPGFGLGAFIGADLLVAAAAAAAGALFGFIFGIPRTLDPASSAVVATAAERGGPASHALMAANTNLERISDWLTTLLIGATLVQIKDIAAWVGSLGKNLLSAGAGANDAVVPIIVIYFFALSFLGVYLITRLYLTSAFTQTLGMLSGDKPAPDLRQLKGKLDAALRSAKTDDLQQAISAYDGWDFSGKESDDPELNADVARILAKLMVGGTPAGLANPVAELKSSVAKAAADSAVKAQLKREFDAAQFRTNDANLDPLIEKLLS